MNPEHEAVEFLDQLGIHELPVRPIDVCNQLQIEYREQSLGNIDGMLFINLVTSRGLISVNSGIPEQGRKNFTCAHELGHYCMDSYEESEFRCLRDNIESFRKQMNPIELRANQFAAEFIMPKRLFKDHVSDNEPDWGLIRRLAALAETSLIATALKFVSVCEYSCAVVVSRKNMVHWFHSSGKFKLFIDMDSRILSPHTIAGQVFQGRTPPNSFEVVKADNWTSDSDIGSRAELLEWTLPMNSYGQVYSLIFDEDEIGSKKDEIGFDEENDEDVDWEPPTFHRSRRK